MNREQWLEAHRILSKAGRLSAAAEVIREMPTLRRTSRTAPWNNLSADDVIDLAFDVQEWADFLMDEAAAILLDLDEDDKGRKVAQDAPPLTTPVGELGLTVRTVNTLRGYGDIHEIGDLIRWTEHGLFMLPNLGRKTLKEITDALTKHGLSLAMELENELPDSQRVSKEEADQ